MEKKRKINVANECASVIPMTTSLQRGKLPFYFVEYFFFLKKTEKKNDVLNGHYHTDVTICNNADKRA